VLTYIFKSASKIATERWLADNKRIGYPSYMIGGGSYTHKAQYSYGWDWGPILPDIGVWKDVELIANNRYKLVNLQIIPSFSEDFEKVDLKIVVNSEINSKDITGLKIKAQITYISPQKIEFTQELIQDPSEEIEFNFSFKPELWWIKELGLPNLYNIKIHLIYNDEVIDEISERFGIREIKVIRRDDEFGKSFFFQLNGIPIFAKGANWIPLHNFIPKGRRLGLYRSTIQDAVDINMNMLRVWGGGICEDDEFYNVCDELGMLIWQDFPYACHTIPPIRTKGGAPNRFYENAERQAVQNIIRIRNHPSLALWCGNNEIEGIKFNKSGEVKHDMELLNAYTELFEVIFPKLVAKYDPTHFYWPSSPSSGGSNGTGTFIKAEENTGDSHFWTVWHGGANFSAYRKNFTRFMSEFGFESFPDIKTCEEFCPPDQFEFESPIMKNHQKNHAGNAKILDYMKKRFKIPNDFKKQVILSQLTQAEAIEYGVEHWRRYRGEIGKERCMGTLYWQLNDCWPVASWSSIDYSKKLAEKYNIPGRWKALHYFANRFYKSTIISIAEGRKDSEIWAVNDLNCQKKVTANWQLLDENQKKLLEKTKEITLEPCSSKLIDSIDLREQFDYRLIKILGKFKMDDDGVLHIKEKSNSLLDDDINQWPLIKDKLSVAIGVRIELKIYNEKEGFKPNLTNTAIGYEESEFTGECVIDEDGLLCIKKQIVDTNPNLYEIPLGEIIDEFLDQDDIVIEVECFKKDPALMICAQLFVNDQIVSETFRSFKSPGEMQLSKPDLSVNILKGNGKNWEVEVNSEGLSMYTYFNCGDLDFWASDNYFILLNNKKIVKLRLLEPISKEDLEKSLTVRSLFDLIGDL
jgi:beta-galactosidase/beta-glucuronidase